jgi:hypothetical protein
MQVHYFNFRLKLRVVISSMKNKMTIQISDQLGTDKPRTGGNGMLQNPSALKKKGSILTNPNWLIKTSKGSRPQDIAG